MIVEQKMTEPEILALFSKVEAGATAGGANRTIIGKGKDVATDVASAISNAYNGVAAKIQNSGPVSGFDVAVDKLTDKLANAAGGQSGAVMTAIKKYREFAKKHPIMQGAIYAGLIALTGLSGAGLGGAALLGGIKAFDKLLLGNKASSALWSGFVTGATAYGIGQAKAALGSGGAPDAPDAPASGAGGITGNMSYDEAYDTYIQKFAQDPNNPSAMVVQQAKQFAATKANAALDSGVNAAANSADATTSATTGGALDLDAETMAKNAAQGKAYGIDGNDTLDQMNTAIMKTAEPGTVPADYSQLGSATSDAATEYTVKAKDTLSDIAQANKVSVDDLMQANPDITNPDVLKAGQTINIPSETGNAVYQGGVGTNADTMSKIASGDYTDSEISQNMAKAAKGAATSPDAASVAADAGKGGAKAAVTGAETPPEIGQAFDSGIAPTGPDGTPMKAVPMDEPGNAVTPGTASDGSYQQAAPLDAAGNPMAQTSFIDLTNGNQGTMNMPDGSSVPVNVFPADGLQPRLPVGSEKIIADLNGQKVTAWVYNGKAYVPNFKMESFVVLKRPLSEIVDKDLTVRMWALRESTNKQRRRGVELTDAGVGLVFENLARFKRHVEIRRMLGEAPGDVTPGRPELPDEFRPDMPGAKGTEQKPGFLSRAWSGIKNVGHQLTTKITADKLKMNWHVAGKPSDSDALAQFLQQQGVGTDVIASVYKELGLPYTDPNADTSTEPAPDTTTPVEPTTQQTPSQEPVQQEPAAQGGGAGVFADPKKLAASFESFMDADGRMPPQLRGVLKDILLTALRTVENRQRKLNNIIKESKKIEKQIVAIKKRK
jgi:LysM repeat protein